MKNFARCCGWAGLAFALCGFASADDLDVCEPANGFTPICGLHHPEDLEAMPGGKLIVVSEYGSLSGAKAGRISSYRLEDGAIENLYPDTAAPVPGGAPVWGDPACPGPPVGFDPHGIHHSDGGDPSRLLVVNHGGRESIELFEISFSEENSRMALTWRGCVVAPAGVWLNDVVGLPGGALAVTNMTARDTDTAGFKALEQSRAVSGYALEWQPDSGWRELPGTAGSLPNGIEVSADGRTLYINYYLGGQVAAVERASGRRPWLAEVAGPDNSSWAPDGRLLVASHASTLDEVLHCAESTEDFCPIPYTIVALDPATGAAAPLFSGGGAPFGGATVALQIGRRVYLGSFAGERMGLKELAP